MSSLPNFIHRPTRIPNSRSTTKAAALSQLSYTHEGKDYTFIVNLDSDADRESAMKKLFWASCTGVVVTITPMAIQERQ